MHRVATRAALGDRLSVTIPDATPRRVMCGEDVALAILYEDDYVIAVDKPAGLVVHPTFKHPTGTLMNALLGAARAWPAGQRPSIVGRLDKQTSGVVLAAKTRRFTPLSSAPRCGRSIWPSCTGRVPVPRGTIDLRIALDSRDRRRVVASAEVGAASVTRFERLSRAPAPRVGLALLQCTLETGRRHQIRAHLQAHGWPLVGDPVYGEPQWNRIDDPLLAASLRAFPRQALHAAHLSFAHPITGRTTTIDAPLPADFAALLETAGLRREACG